MFWWLLLARNALLICLLSLPLAGVWERVDLIKHKCCWGWQRGYTQGWQWLTCSMLECFFPEFSPPPPCCLIRSLLFWTQYQHRALVAHFCGGDKMAWKEDGSVPAASNRCCWQFVLSYIPWFISVEGKRNHFFSSLRNRGWVRWKLALSLRKYRTFCLSSWD